MEFNDFVKELIQLIGLSLSSNVKIQILTANREDREWGAMRLVEPGKAMCPIIYLETYYMLLKAGDISYQEIVKDIVGVYKDYTELIETDKGLFEFGKIKDRVYLEAVNYELNNGILEMAPHIKLFDLAVVAYVRIETADHILVMILDNDYVKLAGVKPENILCMAAINTRKTEWNLCICVPIKENENIAYMLTNSTGFLGAVGFLFTGVLKEISETVFDKQDILIIPLSKHEVILREYNEEMDIQLQRQQVHNMNKELPLNEILSNNIYRYSYKKDEIEIIE